MYNIHQHWDPLRVCAVGRSYPPEFYSFIKNTKARSVMERIAEETEEDYQNLINLLHTFGVTTVRPNISSYKKNTNLNEKYSPPPMTPRDYTAMIGDTFFMPNPILSDTWNNIRGDSWPLEMPPIDQLPDWIKKEITEVYNLDLESFKNFNYETLKPIEELVKQQGNQVKYSNGDINTAMITRVGKDLYHGTDHYDQDQTKLLVERNEIFPNYRNHIVNSGGHSDGTFCPVVPGLIISLFDIPDYGKTFPDWEVVFLKHQGWDKVKPFLSLKEQNKGKWWVPGEESNYEFTEFVETWLDHWVGYVEETVFDVNMLVIDEKNVICNNENDQVFEAFNRFGITPHVCNFRHRFFWDGGLHCITSDLHREGHQKNYFPNRD